MNDSNITLRLAQDEDLNDVARLDRLAFAPLRSNADVIRDWYPQGLELPDRTQFLAVEATTNQAVGAYVQIDLELLFQQKKFPTLGLAGVAVAPERRGQRVARRMIEHALETGRSHQYPLAMLYPFQHGFYRKLGWAWVGRSHQYRVSTTHLPRYSEPRSFATAGLTGIFPYDATQRQALQTVYQTAAVQHNGWIQRREWLWDSLLKPKTGREIYTYVEAGALLGYVVLQFTQLPDRLAVVVREWVALTSTAYRSILGFLASLRDQVSTIVWNTFAEDPFPHLLSEQRRDPSLSAAPFEFGLTHAFGEIGGGFMWRLVDVQRAFEQRPVQAIDPFELAFHIIDPVLGEQTIAVEFSDGHMHLTKQATSAIVHLSIDHLTELFCGFRRAIDLLWTQELELEGDASVLTQLDAAWQAAPPFCWDFF